MFCGKCGAKLDDSVKFCGKCGTKVNNQAVNNQAVNNINSFIGNIVKKTEEQSTDKDIFNQIEEEKDSRPNKNTKKRSTGFKINSKPKKKIKPKPKKKTKKIIKQKVHKKINTKALVLSIVAFLLVISGVASFVLVKYGDDIFANQYVKSSISKTFKEVDKYANKANSIPNILLRENPEDRLNEREINLSILQAKGGLINEDILSTLKGFSIKTNEKINYEKGLLNAKLAFSNNKDEEIYGELFSSPSIATLSVPDLYPNTLGINVNENEDEIVNSQYYTKASELIELLTEYETSYGEFKVSILENSKNLVTNIIANGEFKLEENNEESRIYNTTLNNEYVLESLKTYLTDIKNGESIKKIFSYVLYFIEGTPLYLTDSSLNGKIDRFIANIDNAIETQRVEDIELKLVINDDKIINNVIFKTVIDGIGVMVNINLNNGDKEINYDISIQLINDDSSYISFDLKSLINEDASNKINIENLLTLNTSFNDEIKLSYTENYDVNNYKYNNKIDFIVDSAFENLSVEYNLNGTYQIEKDLEKLDINTIDLDINTEFYKFSFDLDGYVQQQNSSAIEELKLDNVIFIDNMSEDEIDKIKSEIYDNGIEFLDLFGKGKW